jgi:hypothetical protein
MFENEGVKVLLGNSLKEPEVDYDDAEVASETGYPVEESALRQFYFVTVVNSLNTPDFKSHYLSVISEIKKYTTEEQLQLAYSLIDNFPRKYDFEFSRKFDLYNQQHIDAIYEFIEFVEYNNELFLIKIWKNFKVDVNSFNIEQYCKQNSQEIILQIEKESMQRYMPEMIADFLRTNDKENLLQWFCEKSEILRAPILAEII